MNHSYKMIKKIEEIPKLKGEKILGGSTFFFVVYTAQIATSGSAGNRAVLRVRNSKTDYLMMISN